MYDFSQNLRAGDWAEGAAIGAVVAVIAQNIILVAAAANEFVLALLVCEGRSPLGQIWLGKAAAVHIHHPFFKIDGFTRCGYDAFDHQTAILRVAHFHDVGSLRIALDVGQPVDKIIAIIQQVRIHARARNGDRLHDEIADQIVAK